MKYQRNYSERNIGNRLAMIRKEHNLSQGKLAKDIDVSRQSIVKWEKNKVTPRLSDLLLLCDRYGCDLGYLLGDYNSKDVKAEYFLQYTGIDEDVYEKLHTARINALLDPYMHWLCFANLFLKDSSDMIHLLEKQIQLSKLKKDLASNEYNHIYQDIYHYLYNSQLFDHSKVNGLDELTLGLVLTPFFDQNQISQNQRKDIISNFIYYYKAINPDEQNLLNFELYSLVSSFINSFVDNIDTNIDAYRDLLFNSNLLDNDTIKEIDEVYKHLGHPYISCEGEATFSSND